MWYEKNYFLGKILGERTCVKRTHKSSHFFTLAIICLVCIWQFIHSQKKHMQLIQPTSDMTGEGNRGALASNNMMNYIVHSNCKDIAFQSIHNRERPAPVTGTPLHKGMCQVAS